MKILLRSLFLFLLAAPPASAGGLATPDAVSAGSSAPLDGAARRIASKQIQGSWKIVGYRNWHKGQYVEIAIHKERIDETIETWLFRPDGTFRHQMDEKIWFTGSWSITDAWSFEGGTYPVIHMANVQSFLPDDRRANEYHLSTLIDAGRNLVVFQPSRDLSTSKGLNQGHVFERKPYGQR